MNRAKSSEPNPNTSASCIAIILAAGKSTRMRSNIPKPLHPICGKPLSRHVIDTCKEAGVDRTVLIVGYQAEAVRNGIGEDVEYVLQTEQRGSGDAARCAEELLKDYKGDVLVIAGDAPLITVKTLRGLIDHHRKSRAAATMVTAILPDPTNYGRIIRDSNKRVTGIVEQKDGTPDQLSICECNPSIYCFQSPKLFEALREIQPNNNQGEYYLTDVIGVLARKGEIVETIQTDDIIEIMGVNNRVELAEAGRLLRERILRRHMLDGVTIVDPANTYIDKDVRIGQDTVIEPGSMILGCSVVGEKCTIGPNTKIVDSSIGDETLIHYSLVSNSKIHNHVKIGPFSNIRPNCEIMDHVKVGDYVEIKNSTLHESVSASHLTYLGDSEIGEATNIGAGTVTCNYDGVRKHRTVIGDHCFIGTHSTLIAPITIGSGAFIAAASPVNEDIPEDALAIARCRPVVKRDWAKKRRETYFKNKP